MKCWKPADGRQLWADATFPGYQIYFTTVYYLDNDVHDEQSFLTLCEEHFSIKPVLFHLGCRRLGNIPQSAICNVVCARACMSEAMVEHFKQVTSTHFAHSWLR